MVAMSKPVIAVDIDEVLSPLHAPLLSHHNLAYGTNYVYPDPEGRYYLEQFTGEDSATAEVKLKAFVDDPSFPEVVVPLPGAVETIGHLKHDYSLVIVTARQLFYKDVTARFLQTHFPGVFADVHFIPHFAGAALSPAAAKVEIFRQAGAQFVIDDNLGTAAAAATAGMSAILFGDYHWNKVKTLPTGVVRCKNWAAVQEYFDGLQG